MRKFPKLLLLTFATLAVFAVTSIILNNILIPFNGRVEVLTENFGLSENVEAKNDLKCGKFPSTSDVVIENFYWQVLNTTNGTFKIYNAYYDTRSPFKQEPVIRIYALFNRINPKIQTFCQIWFKDMKEPIVVRPYEYKLVWNTLWGVNKLGSSPYLIACKNPLVNQVPSSVSLVENECDEAKNNLQVIYNLPEAGRKKQFGVCVKDLYFDDDVSMKLIEWVEIISLLGADKIFIYVEKLHPNNMKALQYLETQGKVKVEMMSRPNGIPRRNESITQKYHNEIISLNDCLYKHMYEYDYLIPLDSDEIIMPHRDEDRTWSDLIARVEQIAKQKRAEPYAGYSARTAFFMYDNIHQGEIQPEVPANMHFLQQVFRSANFNRGGIGAKSFQKSDMVYTMHNHRPLECIGRAVGDSNSLYFEDEDARLNHYRIGCSNVTYSKAECEDFRTNTVKDLSLWKHKDALIANVNRTLRELETFVAR